jgi:transposase
MRVPEDTQAWLTAKFAVVFPHLDERQRRLLMGAEARTLGHGGIRLVARAAGVREATVSTGVTELEAGQAPLGRVRRPGGGRKRVADLDSGLRPALLALVEPDMRGDPMSPLRWTTKSTRHLATELTAHGHRISADTVADLLREEGFSLQGNTKTVEGKQNPDRDAQFRYLNEQVRTHQADGQPVISVDTKKKEIIGQFKNTGREWHPRGEPAQVSTHDFPDKELGKAVPYGIYDIAANTGWVNVGTDHDTAAFAVESVRRWWSSAGQATYPHASRLLITADAGGSNSYRTRAWKTELAALAAQTGLAITVCHFPPGTSKWNRIEHRLFCHITMNWRGRPLTSHEVVINTIAATTTRTRLRVHCELDTDPYPLGVQISDAQMAELPITRHAFHGEWNYTLSSDPNTVESGCSTDESDPVPPTSYDTATLSHPTLTGMSRPELDTLTTALDALACDHDQARHRQRQHHRVERGQREHAPRSGRPPRLTFPDQVVATVLNRRLSLPYDTLAVLFGCGRSTMYRMLKRTGRLLDQHGTVIEPVASPENLAKLITETKPAC